MKIIDSYSCDLFKILLIPIITKVQCEEEKHPAISDDAQNASDSVYL